MRALLALVLVALAVVPVTPYAAAQQVSLPTAAANTASSTYPEAKQVSSPISDYWERTALPQTGLATFYARGLMEYVEAYRRERGQLPPCPECVGSVALLRAGDIGRKVWLQPLGEEMVGPFLVIDCAHLDDVQPLLDRGWVVDISFDLGQLWGMAAPLAGVTVIADPSPAGSGPMAVPTAFWLAPAEAQVSRPTSTPAVPAATPTRWPTRLPYALSPNDSRPAESRPTPLPLIPTPLTPVVTTPTPEPAAVGATTGHIQAAPTTGPDVVLSLGRPGADLLAPPSPTLAMEWIPTPVPTRITPETVVPAPLRSPSPPVFSQRPGAQHSEPEAASDAPTVLDLWRALLALIVR